MLKSNNAVDAANTLKTITPVIAWLIMFFLLCDFAAEVTSKFASLSDSYYAMLWYCLPVDQQKYFILAILYAEMPVHLTGFPKELTRETYKQVIIIMESFCVQLIS